MITNLCKACIIVVLIAYLGRNTDTKDVNEMVKKIERVNIYNNSFLFDEFNESDKQILNNYDLLYNESDEVLLIKPIAREQYGMNFVTRCVVKDTIKSTDDNLLGKQIFITEQSSIDLYDEQALNVMNVLMPMKLDDSYVVFLDKNNQFKSHYYNPVSTVFGVVPFREEINIYIQNNQKEKFNESILNYDIVFSPFEESFEYQLFIEEYRILHKRILSEF
ncbi:MAG: hypothetical protein ACK5L6_13090 [Anaerorhabdus sp.]|uniref:hypothetical protein n=1 Tax=Anaerorhabdus sp. TaxID=1872524 RepID=UPI003A8A9C66